MGTAFVVAAVVALFALIAIGAGKSDRRVGEMLEREGRLCLGTVQSYDSEDIATVEFTPMGATGSIRTYGIGHFQRKQFPQGSMVAVLYNPRCPSVNRVVPDRTSELR
jgi:hypothetical protein